MADIPGSSRNSHDEQPRRDDPAVIGDSPQNHLRPSSPLGLKADGTTDDGDGNHQPPTATAPWTSFTAWPSIHQPRCCATSTAVHNARSVAGEKRGRRLCQCRPHTVWAVPCADRSQGSQCRSVCHVNQHHQPIRADRTRSRLRTFRQRCCYVASPEVR